MTLSFLRKRRQQKTSGAHAEFVRLIKLVAQHGDSLPVAEQVKLGEIVERAGIADTEIEKAVEIYRQYATDKPARDSIPQVMQSLAQARTECDAYSQETERIKKERSARLDELKRKVGAAQTQLDQANDAKRRADQAETRHWKILGLAPIKTSAHIFKGAASHMLMPGVMVAVNIDDFSAGKLDPDDYQFVQSFNQCNEAFADLVNEAMSYRKLPVDDPAVRVISDPGTIRASAAEPTFRDVNGAIVSTLPANNSKTKWQILTNAGAL